MSDVGIEETEKAISAAHSVQKNWANIPAKVISYDPGHWAGLYRYGGRVNYLSYITHMYECSNCQSEHSYNDQTVVVYLKIYAHW